MGFFLHSTILSGIIAIGQVFQGSNLSQQMSPELIKQIEKTYKSESKKSSSEFNKYLADTSSKNKQDLFDTTENSIIKKDTLTKVDEVKKQKLSVYEKMILGENIHPDSLLSSLSVYGYDVFKNSRPSTFAPNDNAAVPADYPINTDDELNVMLWGRINEEYHLKVGRDGTINIPRIGPISVAGLTFESTKRNIMDRVGKIEGVNVTISMGALRSIGVYIVGEVVSPGYYTVSALSNVTNALFSAGGPTEEWLITKCSIKKKWTKSSKF